MAMADGAGLPLALCTTSASPNEITLVELTLQSCFLPELPQRLIGDKTYDGDPLDECLLAKYGIEMIAQPGKQPAHTGRSPLTPLQTALEDRKPVRLAHPVPVNPVRFE